MNIRALSVKYTKDQQEEANDLQKQVNELLVKVRNRKHSKRVSCLQNRLQVLKTVLSDEKSGFDLFAEE